MKQIRFRDTRTIPAGVRGAEYEARLMAIASGMPYDVLIEMTDAEALDTALEIADQFSAHGVARTKAEGGWTLALSQPVSGIESVDIREPRLADRLMDDTPAGYAVNRRLIARLTGLTGGQVDQLTLGDAAYIIKTAYPNLGYPFR